MIKIENTEIFGWEAAIRGMRNPKNSWDKNDSFFCGDVVCNGCPVSSDVCANIEYGTFVLGPNDLKLTKNLSNAGDDHGKFLRMINVTMDIVAPLYWWKEFDTYKVGTVANSCSTMHKIQDKKFTIDDFSFDKCELRPSTVHAIMSELNENREKFIETKNKQYWWNMIQLLPSSYNQRRTVQLNYQVLKSMYHARKNHKLDEWREFCEWIRSLPYSELITGEEN